MQEIDAERRIQILRGQRPPTPPPPPPPSQPETDKQDRRGRDETGRYRKRRRLAGEDDTDRDIRLAREDAAQTLTNRGKKLALSREDDAPLTDSAGHINLFPSEAAGKPVERNAEAEAESARKKRSYEDQYTMRFSNAAGFNQSVGQKPWYSSSTHGGLAPEAMPGKNVWGDEDPMRREREMARIDANDPLASMKKGVRQLKAVEQQRKEWKEERSRELEALKIEESRRSNHRRRRRSVSRTPESEDSLEGFRLDSPQDKHREDKDRRRSSDRHHRHHRHHRDKSRDRSRTRHHSHSRSHRHHRKHHDNEREDSSRHPRKPETDSRRERPVYK